jgi:SAM-dependent methyltransferase
MWLGLRPVFDHAVAPPRVLDIAPAPALSAALRRQRAVYVTADLGAIRADVRLDITHLPFRTGAFDVVLCSHVLEHVVDDDAAMGELGRVLASSGMGIVLVPIALNRPTIDETSESVSEAEAWAHFAQHDHVRLYNRAGLVARLERAGLAVTVVDRPQLGRRTLRRHGLTPTSTLYVVRAPSAGTAADLES